MRPLKCGYRRRLSREREMVSFSFFFVGNFTRPFGYPFYIQGVFYLFSQKLCNSRLLTTERRYSQLCTYVSPRRTQKGDAKKIDGKRPATVKKKCGIKVCENGACTLSHLLNGCFMKHCDIPVGQFPTGQMYLRTASVLQKSDVTFERRVS